jgi:pyruvate ferredoxin oxidoreductase gamma subunit
MPLKEIRFHGRGGQGAVTSSQVLAIAAFYDGKYCQAFPSFGVERRGAPVESYTRISDQPIETRQHVYAPDYVVVLDSTLVDAVDVFKGLKKGGMAIINSNRPASKFATRGIKVKTIDVTHVALEVIGRPFVNIAVLGAFAALTGEVTLKGLQKAIAERFKEKPAIAKINFKATKRLYQLAEGEG